MHTHDKTLIASLGFNDPDKKNSDHDLACRYISQDDILSRLILAIFPGLSKTHVKSSVICGQCQHRCEAEVVEVVKPCNFTFTTVSEFVISKGEGKYKTHVGFVDVMTKAKAFREITAKPECDKCQPVDVANRYAEYFESDFAIEVKATPCPVRDCIRQINLYREYLKDHLWVLATLFPLTIDDTAELKANGIKSVVVGPGFRSWKSSVQTQPDTTVPTI